MNNPFRYMPKHLLAPPPPNPLRVENVEWENPMTVKHTDRELLEEVFRMLQGRNYVTLNYEALRDMVTRYNYPPLTMHFRYAMQLTQPDYERLGKLLARIDEHLNPPPKEQPDEPNAAATADPDSGNLPLDVDAPQ